LDFTGHTGDNFAGIVELNLLVLAAFTHPQITLRNPCKPQLAYLYDVFSVRHTRVPDWLFLAWRHYTPATKLNTSILCIYLENRHKKALTPLQRQGFYQRSKGEVFDGHPPGYITTANKGRASGDDIRLYV
jgi:hypothetical protein